MHQRKVISAMFQNGFSNSEICASLAPLVSAATVYCILRKVKNNLPLQSRCSTGRKRSMRTQKNIEHEYQHESTPWSMSRRSLSRIIKEDLHLIGYKTKPRQALTPRQMAMWVTNAKKLLHLVGRRNIAKVVFTDEKIFTLGESEASSSQILSKNVTRTKYSPLPAAAARNLLIPQESWCGVAHQKWDEHRSFSWNLVDAAYYQKHILVRLKQWCTISLGGTSRITLQQDWAPTHRAKSSKDWLRTNNIAFLDESVYPAASPDLNPMDFCVCGWMLQCLSDQRAQSVEQLTV